MQYVGFLYAYYSIYIVFFQEFYDISINILVQRLFKKKLG